MSDTLKPLIGIAANRPLTRAEAEAAFNALFEGDNPFDFRQDLIRLDWQANGLGSCRVVDRATNEYRAETTMVSFASPEKASRKRRCGERSPASLDRSRTRRTARDHCRTARRRRPRGGRSARAEPTRASPAGNQETRPRPGSR